MIWHTPADIQRKIAAVLYRRFAVGDGQIVPDDADFLLDYGLDSMQMVQILVDLEMDHQIQVPESALEKEDFSTVAALVRKLCSIPHAPAPAADDQKSELIPAEPELDIKVHCVVSCLCHPLKLHDIDHRALYFGVWDAEIFIDENYALSYHAPMVDHEFFTNWYERLYGVKVERWYDHQISKAANLARLRDLLRNRQENEWIMVMLDLFQLPERENKFNKNPFPHYVMLENRDDPESIWMWDPDFRWQGELNKARVFNAILQPSVAGGYKFVSRDARAPHHSSLLAYFFTSMKSDNNLMTDRVKEVVRYHLEEKPERVSALGTALRELPVLAIRKYAYEHGFAFFGRDVRMTSERFEFWCAEIEKLVKTYDQIQFVAMKYASQQQQADLLLLHQLLQQQDQREFAIKAGLLEVVRHWQKLHGLQMEFEFAEAAP